MHMRRLGLHNVLTARLCGKAVLTTLHIHEHKSRDFPGLHMRPRMAWHLPVPLTLAPTSAPLHCSSIPLTACCSSAMSDSLAPQDLCTNLSLLLRSPHPCLSPMELTSQATVTREVPTLSSSLCFSALLISVMPCLPSNCS